MYLAILAIHNFNRWLILLFSVSSFGKSLIGWKNNSEWQNTDDKLSVGVMGTVHLQFLLGLMLYFWLSPVTKLAFQNMKMAMKDKALRFFAVEHFVGMFVAVIVVSIARVRSKKLEAGARHRFWFIGLLVFILIVLASTPWPGLAHGRPLIRSPF